MCRMIAYHGEDRTDLRSLVECLVKAAEDDPLSGSPHGDGWGIVALTQDRLIHYRSAYPIFDPAERSYLLKLIDSFSGEMKVVVHARKATDKRLVSSIYSHPYLETNDREVLFLAHNGSVDLSLSKELNLNAEYVVDSELIAKFISQKGINYVSSLKRWTRSALNLIILKIDRGSGSPVSRSHLLYYNYFLPPYNKVTEEYYKLYSGKGFVMSSSLVKTGCKDANEVERDKVIEI